MLPSTPPNAPGRSYRQYTRGLFPYLKPVATYSLSSAGASNLNTTSVLIYNRHQRSRSSPPTAPITHGVPSIPLRAADTNSPLQCNPPHPDELLLPQATDRKFYLVSRGREVGIYFNWYVSLTLFCAIAYLVVRSQTFQLTEPQGSIQEKFEDWDTALAEYRRLYESDGLRFVGCKSHLRITLIFFLFNQINSSSSPASLFVWAAS